MQNSKRPQSRRPAQAQAPSPPVRINAEIVMRPTAQLVPYARNARLHSDEQVAQIVAAIREFGFTNPVLVDERQEIIAGHGRVLAAQQLSMPECPTIELGYLNEAQKRAYRLADNKLALNSAWDEDLLRAEIADLRLLAFDLDAAGFTALDLDQMFAADTDPSTEWQGMPEFDQQNEMPFRSIVVHFKDQQSINKFSELVGQEFTDKTKSMWYPEIQNAVFMDKAFVTSAPPPASNGAAVLGYKHIQGGNVPGGHNVLWDGERKPFIPPMRECNSIELRHSDVVVDIGAYCGTYAIRAARFPVRRVVAYEPTPFTFDVLSTGPKLPNLELQRAAVVDKPIGEIEFYVSRGIGVTNSLVSSPKKDAIRVPAVDYVTAVAGASIVKIDIEGGEYALPIIQPSLRAVILDFHKVPGLNWKRSAEQIIDELGVAGFRPVITPDWSCGWTCAGSWVRDLDDAGGGCDALLTGALCCGCGAPLRATGVKAICDTCWPLWRPKHRAGYIRGSTP